MSDISKTFAVFGRGVFILFFEGNPKWLFLAVYDEVN